MEKSDLEKLMDLARSLYNGTQGADLIRALDSSLDSETKDKLQDFIVRLLNGQSSKDLLQPRIEQVGLL